MTTRLIPTTRAVRFLIALLLGTAIVIGGQAFQVEARAASVQWVDGGDDSPCLNDDNGRALDALPSDQWCTPINGCYQGDDGKWVLPSRKTGIWQGNPSDVRYADEITTTPTPKPTTPKPTTPKPTTGTGTGTGTGTNTPTNGLGVVAGEVAAAGAPTAPEAPVLTVKKSRVTVTWKASANAALESVTGYSLSFTDADPVALDAATTKYTFKSLDDGTYRAAIRAVNASGESVSSPPSEPVTVGKPITDIKGELEVTGDLEPGASVVITGTDFAADVPELTLELHSDPVVLDTVATDAEGGFSTTVTVPADIPDGAHQLVVLHEGVEVVSTPVQVGAVVQEKAAAAAPGETVPPYAGLAILAVLAAAGVGALVWHVLTGRRRRDNRAGWVRVPISTDGPTESPSARPLSPTTVGVS